MNKNNPHNSEVSQRLSWTPLVAGVGVAACLAILCELVVSEAPLPRNPEVQYRILVPLFYSSLIGVSMLWYKELARVARVRFACSVTLLSAGVTSSYLDILGSFECAGIRPIVGEFPVPMVMVALGVLGIVSIVSQSIVSIVWSRP